MRKNKYSLLRLLLVIGFLLGFLTQTQIPIVKAQEASFPAQVNNFFTPTTIGSGGTSVFTITITNPNSFPLTLSTLPAGISNTLPSGVTFASPANAATTCAGGSVSTFGTTISLIGGTVPAAGTGGYGICSITVNVTSTTANTYYNTIEALALKATDPTGTINITNQTPSSSNLVVSSITPPSLSKSFSSNTRWVGQNSTLTIRIRNNDLNYDLTQVSLTDNLPTNVKIAGTPGVTFTSNCGAPTITASSGSSFITVSNATIPKNTFCDVSVNVTSDIAGVYLNTIPARAITTQQGVTNSSAASAPINFQSIGMTKSFAVGNMVVGGTTTMSIVMQNPTSSPYTSVAFTDSMPSGMTVVSANSSQCGGTVTIGSGGQSLIFSGGTIPAGSITTPGSCTITATVTGSIAGSFTNTIPANSITTDTSGVTNVTDVSSNITIYNPGTGITSRSKAFSPATIKVDGISTLTIRFRAPADTQLTGFSISDALPVGVRLADVPTATKNANCQGGTFSPSAGDVLLTYSGGTIPAGQECVLTVNVTSSTKGVFTNTISPANISNDQGRNITSSFSANLTVSGLSVSKAFFPPTVDINGISTFTVTLTNTNSNYLENVSFLDTLPTNIVVASTPNVRSTCGLGVDVSSGTSVSLSGGIIPAQVGSVPGVCRIDVDVKGVTTGAMTNTIASGAVSGKIHGTSPEVVVSNPTAATAPITVADLSIGVVKEFAVPGQVNMGSSSKMTVTLTNPNNAQLVGIGFTDNLPTHSTIPEGRLLVADPANASTGNCGGALSIAPDRFSFTFSGGSLAANTSCSLSIDITSNVRDGLTNTIPVDAVTSTNGASNPLSAVATLNNIPGAVVVKKFLTNPMGTGAQTTMQISIQNVASFALTQVGLLDILPVGLVPATEGLSTSEQSQCGGTMAYDSGTRRLTLTRGAIGAASTCTIQVAVTSSSAGTYQNCIQAGALTNTEGATNDLACDTLTVANTVNPPSITKSFLTDPVIVGATSPLQFTITNPNSTILTGIGFTDLLPVGLGVASPPNTSQCNGTLTATVDVDTSRDLITLTGGSIAANSSCTVTVGTKAAVGGEYANVTGNVISTEGGLGNTASDGLTVIAPPLIVKAFIADEITRGATSRLTFTITNPAENTVSLTGVSFSDTFPAGVKVIDPPNVFMSPNCGSPIFTPVANDTSLSFTNGTIQPASTGNNVCTVQVDVTAVNGGIYNNITGKVNSTNGGQGTTASATLTANGVGLSLLKSTSTSYYTAIGNTIVYNYLLTNTGTAVLYAPFTVSDNKITGTIDCGNGGTVTSLAPAATTTCTANYTVVAGDVSTKSVTNTATATAKDAVAGGGDVSSNSSSVTVPLSRLTLDKTTTTTGYRAAGDRIDYTYTLTNTGNTTLYSPFDISDDHFAPFSCGSATVLPPSAVTSCSKTGANRYTVLAGDVTAGSVVNIASATASDGSTGTITSNSDSVTVYAIVGPVISKSFSPNPVAVGGTSLLTFTITNPNSVSSLTGVAFTDTFPEGMTKVSDPSGSQCGGTVTSTANSITLANGFIIPSGSCTVSILVSADVPKQYLNESGTVTSTNGGNGNTSSATLTVLDAPTISKSFSPDAIIENGTSTLTITITNPTGNTGALTGVGFIDSFPTGLKVKDPSNIIVSAGCGSPTFTPLANDVSLTFSGGTIDSGGTCVVSVDVTAPFGIYNNNTQAVTSTNGGTGVPSNVAVLSVSEAVDLSITKTDGKVAKNKGEAAVYTIEVLNAGPSAANGATVYDTFPSSLISPTWTCVPDSGATCTASGSGNIQDVINLPAGRKVTYTVTTSIASNASTDIKNTASVVPPTGLVDLNEANNTTEDINGLNGLTIEKTINEDEDYFFEEVGELVHYAYKVTNSGTSNLVAPFIVVDDNVDAANGEVVCASVPATLAPAGFFTCSATHTVTQADLDLNFITNNVTATAKDGDGDTVTSNTATKTVSANQGPLIGVAKEVTKVEKVSAGTHDVTMTILIKNYGNVTLHNVLVTDNLANTFPAPTTFAVQSITSTDTTLVLNNNPDGTPIFNGSSNINLLGVGNTLEVGQSKSFTLVVRVIPTSSGPYLNSAIAYGTSPANQVVNDLSQSGLDPDPAPHDYDPTNNNEATGVDFGARIFDPPFGIKTLDANLQPYLQWTMVWINESNIVGVHAVVHDPIPVFTEYVPGLIDSGYGVPSGAPAGSTSLGVSCTATAGSTATTTNLCYYEGPTLTYPRGQIIWEGVLGPDLGVVDPKDAKNAISITFGVRVKDSLIVRNNAFIDSDLNGDGDVDDIGERSVALADFVWDITPANLPATGFAPNQVSLLPKQATLYNEVGDIWLEVPKLDLKMPIVGVPMKDNIWDVSWLGNQAGWLDETAYPTSAGNSVITGHVYLSNGKPGPFIDLKKLSWNDSVTIHIGDKQFIYQVRQVKQVTPNDLSVLKNESSSWITLVTCQGYDEESDSYLYRQVVRAVLVDVK